jgi:hypothetical protein
MRLFSSAALVAALLVALLQTGPGGCTLGTIGSANALKLTTSITKGEGQAQLKLTVTNTSTSAVTVRFNTGQRFDFLALEAKSKRIFWRWSHGRPFTQALAAEEFKAGESKVFEATMPYVGLPPTQYEITGFLMSQPRPTKAPDVLTLDLSDKKVIGPYEMRVVAEVYVEQAGVTPTVSLQLLNGVRYKLKQAPESFLDADSFPIEAWLNEENGMYELVDYNWVMAPLAENAQIFMPTYVVYSKTGGIAGIYKGLKIYGDGSYIAMCCQSGEQSKTGQIGSIETLLQFLTAQRVGDFKDHYGKPGAVADGFNEYLFVKNRTFEKQIYVYTDPTDPAPAGFEAIAKHLSELVQLSGF